jgi:hypothetical protein
MESWQIMQVFTLGMPATGPFSTDSWHVSVHLSMAFSMCVLCGNGIGCAADARMPKKSRTAAMFVEWAVVTTLGEGGAVHADAHAPIPRMTSQQRARIRRGYFFAMLCR